MGIFRNHFPLFSLSFLLKNKAKKDAVSIGVTKKLLELLFTFVEK